MAFPFLPPYCASTISPFDLNTRTRRPSGIVFTPTRSAFLVCGLKSAMFETSIGISLSMMPPWMPFIGFGRWCFLTRLMPSTTTCPASMRRSTVPRLPLSRPAMTMTSSPFLIRSILVISSGLGDLQGARQGVGPFPSHPAPLLHPASEHLGSERHDLHEPLGAQLARHRPEDPGADRLELRVEQHGGVRVEAHQRAIRTAHALRGAHDHRVVDLTLLHAPAGRGVLDAHLDHVADARVAALRAAEDLDTHH